MNNLFKKLVKDQSQTIYLAFLRDFEVLVFNYKVLLKEVFSEHKWCSYVLEVKCSSLVRSDIHQTVPRNCMKYFIKLLLSCIKIFLIWIFKFLGLVWDLKNKFLSFIIFFTGAPRTKCSFKWESRPRIGSYAIKYHLEC